MDSVKFCRFAVIFFVCFVALSQCYNVTLSTVKTTAKLTKQLTTLNASINTVMSSTFLTKLVNVAASQDPTIRDVMAAVYNVPMSGLLCLIANYEGILQQIESKPFTVSNIVAAANSKCFLFTSAINNIQTAVNALETKFATSVPVILSTLPTSFQKLVNSGVSFASTWSAATAPSTAISNQYWSLVTQFNAISGADRKKVIKKIAFLKPYLGKKGKLASVVQSTLNALNSSVAALAIQNSAVLSPKVTTLAKGVSTQAVPIAKWFINGVNKLPVSSTIKADSTVASIASEVAKYGGSYGPAFINTASMQKNIVAAVSGSYIIYL